MHYTSELPRAGLQALRHAIARSEIICVLARFGRPAAVKTYGDKASGEKACRLEADARFPRRRCRRPRLDRKACPEPKAIGAVLMPNCPNRRPY